MGRQLGRYHRRSAGQYVFPGGPFQPNTFQPNTFQRNTFQPNTFQPNTPLLPLLSSPLLHPLLPNAPHTDYLLPDLVVAHIDRKIAPFSVKLNKQQYAVTVAPGVDMALVAALCICLDEKHNEKSTNAGLLASVSG